MTIERPAHASVILLPLALLTAALGWWQVERLEAKRALIEQFEGAEVTTLVHALASDSRFARISATGRFDTRRHILLDNQILNGRPGVHVFTPFRTFSGTTVLVNRGWKPMPADRRSLPEVWTPAVPVGIRGILAPPPEHRQKLGSPDVLGSDGWPQLVTYLDIEAVAAALQTSLPDRVIWLSPGDAAGFEGRDWSPVVMTPERHKAYAVQWFALSAAALLTWVILIFRGMGRSARGGKSG